jgi:hypothetical protein
VEIITAYINREGANVIEIEKTIGVVARHQVLRGPTHAIFKLCAVATGSVFFAATVGASVPVYGGPLSTATTTYRSAGDQGEAHRKAGNTAGIAVVDVEDPLNGGESFGRQAFRLTPLGPQRLMGTGVDQQGRTQDYVYALDAAGNAFGSSVNGASFHAVRWSAGTTTPTVLNAPTAYADGSSAAGIKDANASGAAVGGASWIRNNQFTGASAVLWAAGSTSPAVLQPLSNAFDSGNISSAEFISDSGKIAGYSSPLQPNGIPLRNQPVRWNDAAASPQLLQQPVPSAGSTFLLEGAHLTGIDDAGNIIGRNFQLDPQTRAPKGLSAYRWSANSATPTRLEPLSVRTDGFSFAEPTAINGAGVTVGLSELSDADGDLIGMRAVRWSPGSTTPVALALVGPEAIATCINASGFIGGFDTESGAVVWTPQGELIELNALIAPDAGWELTSVFSISASGWVVGSGFYDADGNGPIAGSYRPYLLQISVPEPTSIMAAAGILSFAGRRKRQR